VPRSKKSEPSSWESYFASVVTDVFDFLVTEHGFARGEPRRIGYELYLEFTRPLVAVEIGLGSDFPFTFVKYLQDGVWRRHNLSSLVRGPLDAHYTGLHSGPFSSEPGTQEHRDAIRGYLNVDANLLRSYGQQFLNGDPSLLMQETGTL
jgi:hypothetical protein